MPRKGHSPEKILNKLRQVEVAVAKGSSVAQAVRDINVSETAVLLAPGVRRSQHRPGKAAQAT